MSHEDTNIFFRIAGHCDKEKNSNQKQFLWNGHL